MSRFFNVSYLARKSIYYGRGLLSLNADDVLLASFPKSGNTWVRFFLCNLISLEELDCQVVGFPLLDATMPELGRPELLQSWPYRTLPRVVKTHHSLLPSLRNRRHIVVYRDPRDVMVSMYHYVRRKRIHYRDISLESVVYDRRRGLQAWFEWHERWKQSKAQGIWVAYESLKLDPEAEFSRILRFLHVEAPEQVFKEAIKRSSIESVRRSEKTHGYSKPDENRDGFTFARSGENGQWEGLFSKSMLAEFERLKSEHPNCAELLL